MLEVNQTRFIVKCRASNGVEWPRGFVFREDAEFYLRTMDELERYEVIDSNFDPILPVEKLEAWNREQETALERFKAMELDCLKETNRNLENPYDFPCEICGEQHPNHNCCSQCNYDEHRCRFCGDYLGHKQVSVCYLMDDRERMIYNLRHKE